ncbi:response regulator transcription factor [Streptomyces sp. P9(2023)]|uniref:response regulator transcription factor n=1 Tax=Streptomyces sp. P9(2023) TaxID=3064394 RepID=UPI0028F43DAB|nr:response regulator transcription factor [Streptomyces sp. P9(2023)]MDT9691529.1 response regulator transcription factor [Streptomyces sp. P9(2023)]
MNQPSTCVLEPHIHAPRNLGALSHPAEQERGRSQSGAPGRSAWRVLVVESDHNEAETLARGLRRHGHEVDNIASGSEALHAYGDADLILLDLELPDLDGLEVCQTIRTACDIPIIAVTARGSELDRVLGLQAGADDYLTKPYGFRELMARMDAVMRRARPQAPAPSTIEHGPLLIDTGSREVTLDGRPIAMTRKEFDLLCLLASNPDTVIPRKRLMQQVWGDSWSRRTVDTHVSTLRNKLGASSWVVTVRGVGFRLGHG